ncbi:hypothetical protein MRB53_015749 [Persea americana]|uniref:Uncharacterized protein n=1 Tax=Persea americana TaxID=3435 RepID=A0ACC2M075_PERAE|nr:hypothetical protein MRB53_015749 [Persea americana]
MALTSGIFTCSLGTVTVSTPFSIAAFTSSTLAFSGNLNRLRNLPLLLSTRCHLSFFSSCSLFLSPLICRTLPSSSSTFTSSFFRPGRSALKTWASGVFLPVYMGVGECRCFITQVEPCKSTAVEWEALEWVPNVKREGIEDVGSSAEEAGDERCRR